MLLFLIYSGKRFEKRRVPPRIAAIHPKRYRWSALQPETLQPRARSTRNVASALRPAEARHDSPGLRPGKTVNLAELALKGRDNGTTHPAAVVIGRLLFAQCLAFSGRDLSWGVAPGCHVAPSGRIARRRAFNPKRYSLNAPNPKRCQRAPTRNVTDQSQQILQSNQKCYNGLL